MNHNNFKSYTHSEGKDQLVVVRQNDLSNKKNYIEGKICKHRNSNGWCDKGQQLCPLVNLIFINQ